MDRISNICASKDLFLIEDSAQAVGAKYHGKYAGTWGIGGCFSFYPAKTLGCLGDGGAVITPCSKIASKVRQIRDHGRSQQLDNTVWGRNSRLDNLQAAFLRYFLTKYNSNIDHRRHLADLYYQNLKHIPFLKLPTPPSKLADSDYFVYQNFEFSLITGMTLESI